MNNVLSFLQKKKKWVIIALVVLIAPYALGVTGLFAAGTWRYKMTVVVETPEGLKEGSSVRQVSNWAMIDLINWPGVGNPAKFKGEAIVVDLDERGLLFTTLGVDPYYEFYNAFSNPYGKSTPKGINYYNWNVLTGTEVNLERQHYPLFVIFDDISNPKSIQLAYKSWSKRNKKTRQYELQEKDNLEELFGSGVRIKEIRIRKVQSPVTEEIVSTLPWSNQMKGYLHGGRTSRGSPLGLHGGNFKRER